MINLDTWKVKKDEFHEIKLANEKGNDIALSFDHERLNAAVALG